MNAQEALWLGCRFECMDPLWVRSVSERIHMTVAYYGGTARAIRDLRTQYLSDVGSEGLRRKGFRWFLSPFGQVHISWHKPSIAVYPRSELLRVVSVVRHDVFMAARRSSLYPAEFYQHPIDGSDLHVELKPAATSSMSSDDAIGRHCIDVFLFLAASYPDLQLGPDGSILK